MRLYARFDTAHVGAGLELQRSDTVLTYTGAADINRCARLTDGKTSGVWGAEWIFWGDADIDDALSIGLVDEDASLANYVGGDEFGYGYRVAEGEIHNDGASIEAVTAGAKGQLVGMLYDGNEGTVTWFLDGIELHTVTLPHAGPWYLAGTVCGATGYDLFLMLVTGQRAFEFLPRHVTGWFQPRESGGVFRVADKPFITAASDATPHVRYRGRLMEGSKLSVRRRMWFRPWGSRGASAAAARGTLVLGNADRAYDALIARDMRDAQVRLLRVPDGGTYADAEPVGDFIVERGRAPGDDGIEVTLSDPIAQLAQALQRRMIRPDADESSADTVYPISLGACRSISPPLLAENPDEDEPEWGALYALHDGMPAGLGYVRDGGFPFDYTADPPDYSLDALGRLRLARKPFYDLTVDVSSVGGDLPGGPDDLLDGAGSFDDAGDWVLTGATVSGGRLRLENVNTSTSIEPITSYARPAAWSMEAGKSYRIRIEIEYISPGATTWGLFPAVILSPSNAAGTGPKPRSGAFWTRVSTGVYTTIISPATSGPLWVALVGTGFNGMTDSARIKMMEVFEVVLDPVDDEALEPITLAPLLEELIEVRAGWRSEQWSRADAEAIDTGTGSAGIGLHSLDATTIEAVLRDALDSWCACAWRDRAGVLRVSRLVAPETRESIGTITRNDMLGELKVEIDEAAALTTQAKGRKNWSPLARDGVTTDTEDVPISLLERLRADFRLGATYSGPLAGYYSFASYAKPAGFLIDKRRDLQRAIDHECGLYERVRVFATCQMPWDSAFELDQVYDVIYTDDAGTPIYELGAPGRRMVVVDIDEDPVAETLAITFWG